MPAVNWDAFAQLSGAPEVNFEQLCRALIRRHYGRYGDFVARAAQPGVEFHLRLNAACSLGEPGRWYGWQCRWYDLPSGRPLGARRREKIVEAIETTERELPDLTDWVLWTRRPLTRGDQDWFYALPTGMHLVLWTAAEVEEHLSGDAEILRATYFGELVLRPDDLAGLHAQAVAPIRRRWLPQVHQPVDAERALRRMLGDTEAWEDLQRLAGQLAADAALVDADLDELTGPLADATAAVAEFARDASSQLADAHAALERGDLDLLRRQLAAGSAPPSPEPATLPRGLRARRRRAALPVTNALADAQLARNLLANMNTHLGARLVAVVADAGCGKTQLAAQLTAAGGNRPAGILLHGRDLHAGHNLDDLAHRVVLHGTPVPSIEALLGAVDAAGQRAHCRLPIVIDGLNDAEDPRDWKSPLASLNETLRRYPYVLVVCTLRTPFVSEALPPDTEQLEIPDFGHDTDEAIKRYFDYYRINPADAELPLGLLRLPLTLRLFCEVANPTREREVGVEVIPRSLSAIFDRYLEQAAERIAETAPRTHRYYEQDVRAALDEIGIALWERRTRSLDLADLRRRLGDQTRPWDQSIVRALEDDGVLLRVPGEAPKSGSRVTALYDALAGHLIADAVLGLQGRSGLEGWLHDPATMTALAGPLPDQHPLATDTFHALVGLVPRRLHRQQLWPLLAEPLRTAALRAAADLDGAYLDADTVEQLKALAVQPPAGPRDLFDRLYHTRASPTHPLNAEFLDAVLRPMAVADRDRRWTEWIRRHRDDILPDLRRIEQRWHTAGERSPADWLRARWVMWTLTSTVRQLRDQATRTLYWFSRGDPAALFALALDALAVNDTYVSERLLAAAYGTAMAHQLPDPTFARALGGYLAGLQDALTGPAATHPTSHWLARLYAQGTVTLALTYYPDTVPVGLAVDGRVPFAPARAVDPIPTSDPRAAEVDRTLHMDFENYTLGRLFRDRGNYQRNHAGHRDAVAHVRGTVWALGWRQTELGAVDAELVSTSRRGSLHIERYGKKYGWIGFYTHAGRLDDDGKLHSRHTRLSDVDIDPSFPEPPPPTPITVPVWARPTPTDDRRWIRDGIVRVPDELLRRPDIGAHQGPWIAVRGELIADEQAPGRRVFGILTGLLVSDADVDRLADALGARGHPGRWWLPEPPMDYYTFAGEIPWSPQFARSDEDDDAVQRYCAAVSVGTEPPVEAEILAHEFVWESYHSALNNAGRALVPSRSFSAAFDLRGMPQTFHQALLDGTVAAASLRGPAGFNGRLLYLREDLVHQYAAGRRLIWFTWGERELHGNPISYRTPSWLARAYHDNATVWRHIRYGQDLSSPFAAQSSTLEEQKRGSGGAQTGEAPLYSLGPPA